LDIFIVVHLFSVFCRWAVDSASFNNLRFDQYEWEVKVAERRLISFIFDLFNAGFFGQTFICPLTPSSYSTSYPPPVFVIIIIVIIM